VPGLHQERTRLCYCNIPLLLALLSPSAKSDYHTCQLLQCFDSLISSITPNSAVTCAASTAAVAIGCLRLHTPGPLPTECAGNNSSPSARGYAQPEAYHGSSAPCHYAYTTHTKLDTTAQHAVSVCKPLCKHVVPHMQSSSIQPSVCKHVQTTF
jgi:hypothetical protein